MSDRVIYVANARLPSRKAHTYQIVQMCQAFVEDGVDVELVGPHRKAPEGAPEKSPDAYYDTPFDFEYTTVPCLDLLSSADDLPKPAARLAFYLQAITFALASLVYVTWRHRETDLVFSRSLSFTALAAPVFGEHIVLEIHHIHSREWVMRLLGVVIDHLRGVVVITEGLSREWSRVTDTEILVAPDGVSVDRFEIDASQSKLRDELSLPADAPVVCYAGSLQRWKGVDTLIKAAARLPPETVVCIVGGTDAQRNRLRSRVGSVPDQVRFVGHVHPKQIPRYLLTSDVLVLPNTGGADVSRKYTSPLKLFEYMAAGRPIVASDLPSIREILDAETAFLCTPDDPESLANAITSALGDDSRAASVAETAARRVEEYTWVRRAERILNRYSQSTS